MIKVIYNGEIKSVKDIIPAGGWDYYSFVDGGGCLEFDCEIV